jgi:glycosyltransferase involved in cell wall biosynthesis
VVATDVGDLRAFIHDYSAGIVVPPNDPSAIARGMCEMMSSSREKYRARLSELAAQFDLARSADNLLRDISAVIGH